MQSAKSRREDADLAARFGPAFDAYAARVPAFLPRLGRRYHPDVAERAEGAAVQTTTQGR